MGNSIVEKCKKLMELAGKEDANLRQLSSEIASQNEILQEVLRKVNSLETGLVFEVDDPAHATAILGRRKLNEVLRNVMNVHQKMASDMTSAADLMAAKMKMGEDENAKFNQSPANVNASISGTASDEKPRYFTANAPIPYSKIISSKSTSDQE